MVTPVYKNEKWGFSLLKNPAITSLVGVKKRKNMNVLCMYQILDICFHVKVLNPAAIRTCRYRVSYVD